jgi:transcription elongation factor GreA
MNKVPMTVAGEAALREELDRLKRVDRPRIVEAIAVAREHGDLKENAEYHAAREQQSFNEGRVIEIESKLSNIQVIDVTTIPHPGKVNRIVGEDEADVKQNLISIGSPVARALIGKEEGDVVVVRAPSGDIEYEIDQVHHI